MEGGVWGVVIVGCAFMIQVISFGTESTIGVYNIEFLEYFKDQTFGVSLIGSINFGVYLASGPIVSLLMTKLSYRKIAMGGSLLVVTGLLGMRAYPFIPTMCFFFGVLTGFGNCCVYIPSHVLSGLYFEKYRSLATGISNSGSGLGAAIMPVLAGIFIDIYSWKGSLVILAGLNLHLFIFCALLRKPPGMASWHVIDMEMEVFHADATGGDVSLLTELETVTDDKTVTRPSPSICVSNSFESPVQVQDFKIVEDDKGFNLWGLDRNKLGVSDPENFNTRSTSSHGFVQESSNRYDDRPTSLMLNTGNRVMWKSQSFAQPSARKVEVREMYLGVKSSSFQPVIMGWRGSCLVCNDDPSEINGVDLYLNDYEAPLKQIEDNKQHISHQRPQSSRHIFIFTNYGFDVYFLSNMLWNAGYTIIQAFAPEFMREQGLSPIQVAWLSGAFGFGCFIGGIFGACCGNVRRVNRKVLYTFANVAMGCMMLLFPNYNHMIFFAVTLIMSGLAFGIILGLLIIVLTDLIGPKSLGNGIGYLMLSNGVGAFLGPPIASLLHELTGGFKAAIFLAGVLCIMGGLVMLLMPCERFLHCSSRGTDQAGKHSTNDNTCIPTRV